MLKTLKRKDLQLSSKKQGFSLIEVLVAIAIMAVLGAVVYPALIRHIEEGKADKDRNSAQELVTAIQVAMTDEDVYNEVLNYAAHGNVSSYCDTKANYSAAYTKVFRTATGNHKAQWRYKSEEIKADEQVYKFSGNMHGVTLTFQPTELEQGNKTKYNIENAIVNKALQLTGSEGKHPYCTGATNFVQSPIPDQDPLKYSCETPDYTTNGILKHMYDVGQAESKLYAKLKSTFGSTLELDSQTYRNSDFTVFIYLPLVDWTETVQDDVIEVYGQFNGTNISQLYVPEEDGGLVTPNNGGVNHPDFDDDDDLVNPELPEAEPEFTVALNANGGTGGSSSTKVKEGGAFGRIQLPTREGYVFNGYYAAPEGIDAMKYNFETYNGANTLRVNFKHAENNWTYRTSTDKGRHIYAVIDVIGTTSVGSVQFNDKPLNNTQYTKTVNGSNLRLTFDFEIAENMVTFATYDYESLYRFIDIEGVNNSTVRVEVQEARLDKKQYIDVYGSGTRVYDKNQNTTLYAHWTPVP